MTKKQIITPIKWFCKWVVNFSKDIPKTELSDQKILNAPLSEFGKPMCGDDYPIFVAFVNKSGKIVEYISFRLIARIPNHSTNIAKPSYADYSSDRILKPDEGWGSCWRVELVSGHEGRDLGDLEYEAEINYVKFR